VFYSQRLDSDGERFTAAPCKAINALTANSGESNRLNGSASEKPVGATLVFTSAKPRQIDAHKRSDIPLKA
jgi:hypothetical protein